MPDYNICIIAQNGRLGFDALLFMLSFRKYNPGSSLKIYVCTPLNDERWNADPDISGTPMEEILSELGATVVTFRNEKFGSAYPHSNKIYALSALPPDEPFVFFDTDHLVLGDLGAKPLEFARPSAVTATKYWPALRSDTYSRDAIWTALYDRFDLDPTGWFRDEFQPNDPRRYPYYNAGCYFHASAGAFHDFYRQILHDVSENPPQELSEEKLYPNLDQILLPLVLCKLGADNRIYNRRKFIFGDAALHYFTVPRLHFSDAATLQIAKDLIYDGGYADVFRSGNSYGYYFFGEGKEILEEVVIAGKKAGKKYPELRNELAARNAWRKG